MRLRKTMKRTAAAVLALSMAVSAAAMPASAGYTIDMSDEKITGNVEIKQETDGSGTKITISVDGKDRTTEFTDDEAGDKITITGDNRVTKPAAATTAAAEAAKDDTKAPETTVEENKDGTVIDYTEKQDAQPEQEASRPEGAAPDMEADPAGVDDQQEETDPEADKDDPDGQNDQNNQSGQNTQNEDSEDEDADAGIMTYEAPAPTTLTSAVEAAARKVISIINNATGKELAVTLKNLKVDAGETNKNAVTIEGNGDVTLELDGKTELKGGSKWSSENTTDLTGGAGLYAVDDGKLTIQDEDKNGSLTAAGGDVETSTLRWSQSQRLLRGGDGIRADHITVSGAEIKAEGGDSKVTGRSDVKSAGGDGIRVTAGSSGRGARGELLDGAHITATGGNGYTGENALNATGGNGIYMKGTAVIDGVSISAAGGSAKSESRSELYSGSAMYICSNRKTKLTMKDSTLELTGGSVEGKGRVTLNSALTVEDFDGKNSMKNMTITAVAGKGESSKEVKDKGILRTKNYDMTLIEIGGNSTINLVGTKTGGVNAKDNTVVNLYVPKDETLNKPDSVDNISTGETGKVNIYENSTATKNDDGTITVTGDLTGIKKGDHSYRLDTVPPTCTTPGKRVYTCTTEGHERETYEETIDALGHEFVNGVCTRCGAPEQAAAENSSSSAVTLTVTGAEAYETSIVDGRYTVAVPAETAVLSGCLGNLKELKAKGADTIVFRTQLRETALNIDSMLSLGVDDTLFTLTHSGESAELTVGGVAHNELLH